MDKYDVPSYDEWLWLVDQEVQSIAGCSVHDLADASLRSWFDSGMTHKEAAEMALKYDGFN